MTTKYERSGIRQAALASQRKEQHKTRLAHEASQREPHWFGLNMLNAINGLSTDIRRLKRDDASQHLTPEHREAISPPPL